MNEPQQYYAERQLVYVETCKKHLSVKMTKKSKVFRHLLIWLIFISYEMAFLHFTAGFKSSYFKAAIFYILNISLFYLNAHVILDFAFFRTKTPYFIATILIFIELVFYLIIKLILDLLLAKGHIFSSDSFNLKELYLFTNIWRGLYFIGLSIAYWSTGYMIKFKERNHLIETEYLKSVADKLELENKYIVAENAYLQNQISPHLLFNSLSFIYNSIYKLSEKAGKGIMLLAEIMRYSLVSSEDKRTVPLTLEAEQIDKLIELSHLRHEGEMFVKFRKKGKLSDIQVLPLIFITLVENMIKHGDINDADNPASVRLEQKDNLLVFTTTNKKRTGSPHPKGGLGLKNIEKRLVNYYQERFTLEIRDKEDEFSVSLTLLL